MLFCEIAGRSYQRPNNLAIYTSGTFSSRLLHALRAGQGTGDFTFKARLNTRLQQDGVVAHFNLQDTEL